MSRETSPRLVVADRGDPLVSALCAALRERFVVVSRLDTELTRVERLLVAVATYRPSRRAWVERFHKSNLGVGLRSRRARAGLADVDRTGGVDVVLQTHALFDTSDPRTVMYVDCTHRQSMAQWPDWNPLRGRALDRWLTRERHQYHRSAHVFAFCEETATSLRDEYGVPPERVTVVGAGLNVGSLPTLPPSPAPDAEQAPPTVLFVGNDFERKGGPRLLAAFADVRSRVPGARLQLVGTRHRIADQDGVEQLGRITDRQRLADLYAGADVFCLPSRFDPFPGALLEAMAHALPSVVSDSCGIPEIVGSGKHATAVTVARDGRPGELADALVELLEDPERSARLGALARHRVADRFLWPHVVDRMAPVLDGFATSHESAAYRTSEATR